MDEITRAEDWTDGEPDPKTDLKKAIMLEHPMHREGLIKGSTQKERSGQQKSEKK